MASNDATPSTAPGTLANNLETLALTNDGEGDAGALDVLPSSQESVAMFVGVFSDLLAFFEQAFNECEATRSVVSRWEAIKDHDAAVTALMTVFKVKCDKHREAVEGEQTEFVKSFSEVPIIKDMNLTEKYAELDQEKARPLFWDLVHDMDEACTFYASAGNNFSALLKVIQKVMVTAPPSEVGTFDKAMHVVNEIIPTICSDTEAREILGQLVMHPDSLETCVEVIAQQVGGLQEGGFARNTVRLALQNSVGNPQTVEFVGTASKAVGSLVKAGRAFFGTFFNANGANNGGDGSGYGYAPPGALENYEDASAVADVL